MKTRLLILIVAPLFGAVMATAAPMGTAFTYQGLATDNGLPATGLYDVQCLLYDAPTNGVQVGSTLNLPGSTTDNNGVFTMPLDFGAGPFNGQARWLEWRVRTNGSSGAYTTLAPRQELTPVPGAIWANTAQNLAGTVATVQIVGDFPTARLSGVLPNGLLAGTYSSAVYLNNAGNSFSGAFSGSGSGLNNVNADLLDGYHYSSFAMIGTSPNFSDITAARLNVGTGNSLSGSYATIPGGYQNKASGNYSFAAGNRAKANHNGSFVWADTTAADFASTATNQFLIRAKGGVLINTNRLRYSGAAMDVAGVVHADFMIADNLECDGNLQCGGSVNFYGSYLYNYHDLYNDGALSSASITINPVSGYAYKTSLWMDSSGANQMYMSVGANIESYLFTFYGNGAFKCRDLVETSDARFKRNVAPLGDSLDLVTRLRGVSFEWDKNQVSWQDLPEGRQIGLIAQEVEKVLPEVVHQDKDGMRSVSYTKLVPVLIEAIKEQRQRTEKIATEKDADIQALKQELAELKTVVSELVGQQKQGGK